jgi:hypothetical protein
VLDSSEDRRTKLVNIFLDINDESTVAMFGIVWSGKAYDVRPVVRGELVSVG